MPAFITIAAIVLFIFAGVRFFALWGLALETHESERRSMRLRLIGATNVDIDALLHDSFVRAQIRSVIGYLAVFLVITIGYAVVQVGGVNGGVEMAVLVIAIAAALTAAFMAFHAAIKYLRERMGINDTSIYARTDTAELPIISSAAMNAQHRS